MTLQHVLDDPRDSLGSSDSSGRSGAKSGDKEVININATLQETNRIIRQANPEVISQAKLAKGGYLLGMILIFGMIAIWVPYGTGLALFGIIFWIVLVLVKGSLSVGTNAMVFFHFLNTAIKVGGPGLKFCLWPIENFNPIGVNLGYRDIPFNMTIELKRTQTNPRTWIDIKKGLVVGRVVNPFKYVYQMPGDTVNAKREVITEKIKDEIQTFINTEKGGLSEDEVLSLSGREIIGHIESKIKEIVEGLYGFKTKDITLGESQRSQHTVDITKKEYDGEAEGQMRTREMESLAGILFGTRVEDLSLKQRRELKDFYLSTKTIESLDKTDKTIFGGPEEIKKQVVIEKIAEDVIERRKNKKRIV